ncbi:MAG: lipase [Microbacterium sp.]|nr:MAG: lipase [Microbacterium sp.]
MVAHSSPSIRALKAAAGLAAIVGGAMLLPRPLSALLALTWVLGAAIVAAAVGLARTTRWSGWGWAAIAVAVVAAAGTVMFPAEIIRALPTVLGVLFALNALRLVTRAVRQGAPPSRVSRVLFALASGAAAVLVWLWPDVALLLLGWTTATALNVAGAVLLWRAVRGARNKRRQTNPRRHRGGLRVAAAAVTVVAMAALSAGSIWLRSDINASDDFYSWSSPVPDAPGEPLRVAPYDGDVPEGADALRILYATTRADGSAAVASAVVVIPTASSPEDRLVLAWQHGTTGVAQPCAPSLTDGAVTDANLPGITQMVARGWLVVATDYPGQGTSGRYPYLIGEGEGRATLDAVRAARQLDDANASNRVMVWGHSQGGHATLWAGQIAEDYAPELHIEGVAALSAAVDPFAMAQRVTGAGSSALGEAITSFVLVPYADEYPDITIGDVTHPAGAVFAESAASRCVLDRGMLVTVLVSLGLGDQDALYRLDLDSGSVRYRLEENIASGIVPAPLYLGQGVDDEVIPIEMQRTLAASLYATGRTLEVHEYPGRTHMGVVAEDSPLIPDLFAWADGILDGDSAPASNEGCVG